MIKFLVGNKIQIGVFLIMALATGWFFAKSAHYQSKYKQEQAKVFVYESRVQEFEQSISVLTYTVDKQNMALQLLAKAQIEAHEASKEAMQALAPIIKQKTGLIMQAELAKAQVKTCEAAIEAVRGQLKQELDYVAP